ncbi:helix-turn-helix transcriptional regulator [Thermostaphylospora chromogena]|uniref:helix-turn-helix transcriptional regulator n=1 Tax=Thermostaphylospora chromogena TaxID=35622 RepID=UPI001F619E59|nr:helix-turn-helix transcriptional regulator [Thermostaphylospora chromogena]
MYVEWAPEERLAGRIACLWSYEAGESDAHTLVVPDGCVDLIWGPQGPFVAGPDTGPHPTSLSAGETFTGIRFLPGAVGGVLGVPMDALRDLRVPLADLGERGRPPFEVRGPDDLARAVAVRLSEAPGPDPAAPAILRALRVGTRVGTVAADLGFSERHLYRRCMAAFGYGPKTVQRVMRFQHALRLARRGRPLADVAAASGYADQAHMTNDVRRLAGVPLSELAAPAPASSAA